FVSEDADSAANGLALIARLEAAVGHRSARWGDERRQHAQERRFARAVRAEQAEDVAGAEREGHARHRLAAAEVPREIGDVDVVEVEGHGSPAVHYGAA